METTSRESIQHKIRKKEDGKPDPKSLDTELAARVKDFLESGFSISKNAMMRKIYTLVDEIMAINDDICVCRKGCSWCCDVKVEILPIEAEYIAANTEHKLAKKPLEFTKGYCPLMDKKTGCCTVYEFRPFNCRAFATYDSPDYCRDDEKHYTNGGPMNGFGSEALLYLAMRMAMVDTGLDLTPDIKSVVEKRVEDLKVYFK